MPAANWVVEGEGQLIAFAQMILDAPCPSLGEKRGIEILRFTWTPAITGPVSLIAS